MGSNRKIDKSLSFKNFSPYYERALAESKRGENVLKIMEKDIDRRKMLAYSQLSAEQRLVEKDLHALKMAQRRILEDRRKRNRRAVSESGLDDLERSRLQRHFTSMDSLTEINVHPVGKNSSSILPPLRYKRIAISSSTCVPQRRGPSDVFVTKKNDRSLSSNERFARRSISAPSFTKTSEIPFMAGCSTSMASSNNVFDGEF